MAMMEDLDVFFDVDEFAVTATLGDGGTMPVIFDRAHVENLVRGGDATVPAALARSADVAGNQVRAGTTIRIPKYSQAPWGSPEWWGGTLFTVRGLEPDGTGLTLLTLEAP